jgi:hypothetical protein
VNDARLIQPADQRHHVRGCDTSVEIDGAALHFLYQIFRANHVAPAGFDFARSFTIFDGFRQRIELSQFTPSRSFVKPFSNRQPVNPQLHDPSSGRSLDDGAPEGHTLARGHLLDILCPNGMFSMTEARSQTIFVSYTYSDRNWAYWIGWLLRDNGYSPRIHEWEVGAGENIARWMEESLNSADRLLGIFSEDYVKAIYSSSERWAAYWDDVQGLRGFLIPVEVEHVAAWPMLVRPLKRLSLVDLSEDEATSALLNFLAPPSPPKHRPPFPSTAAKLADSRRASAKSSVHPDHRSSKASSHGEELPDRRPAWPGQNAFVISDLGPEGSYTRAQADWVLDKLINQACDRLRPEGLVIHPRRIDQSASPSGVDQQIPLAILNDRLIFAVLSGNHPNVYYELGIAIAAGKPVIVLLDNEQRLPEYLLPEHLKRQILSYQYSTEGQALESKIVELTKIIRTALTDVSTGNPPPLSFINRNYEFKNAFREISIPDYCENFLQATTFIGLQGISLLHFTRSNFLWSTHDGRTLTFFDIVKGKILFDAVDVRIVFMHENNAALPHLMKFRNREIFTESVTAVRQEIKQSFEAWSALKREIDAKAPEREDGRKGNLEIHQLEQGIVNYRLSITDQRIILTPYLNIFPFNSQGPALICQAGTPFYDRILREFFDRTVSSKMATAALNEHGNLTIGHTG